MFGSAVKADANDPWAQYGLALTLVRAKKTMAVVRTMGVADGEAMLVAPRALWGALDRAPDFIAAAKLLAVAAERPKNRAALYRAYSVLEKHGKLATVLKGSGSTTQAAAADADALEREAATALDHLQRARALFARNSDNAGEAEYFNGVALWDSAAAEAYIGEALLTATQQEAVALTDGTLDKRANALKLFWKKRMVRDGVSVAERLGEHYRRIAHARVRYPMRSQERTNRDVFGNKRTGIAKEIDDRGLLYIRYGDPTERTGRAGSPALNVRDGETWGYLNPDGRWSFYHFANGQLTPNIMQALGGRSIGGDPTFAELMGAFAKYDPRYAFIAARAETIRTWGFPPRGTADRLRMRRIAELQEDIVRQNERITIDNRERIFQAFESDAAPARFGRPLTVFHDFATFRGNGCTDFVYTVAAAVPSYRVSLAIADTFFWDVEGIDTVVSKELTPGGYLRSTGVLCTKPDHNAYARLTVNADSTTGATMGGDLTIPDYADRSQLILSDLLFATTTDGPFVRGRARLALVPPRQFREGESFRAFYELYNLPLGRRYKTDITFETMRSNPFAKLFKGKSKTTVSFEDEVRSDGVVQELRTLVPETEPGEVRITVKVTDLTTGVSASRKETVWILPTPD